jgi:hypothetical protein
LLSETNEEVSKRLSGGKNSEFDVRYFEGKVLLLESGGLK